MTTPIRSTLTTPRALKRPTLALALPACLLVAAAWGGEPGTPAPERQEREVRFEPYRVTDAIYMLDSGLGGNVGVCLGEDGIFLIDDQFDHTAPALRAALEELSDGEVELLLNTHHHGDHSGGNPILGEGATILAHENVRARLQQPGRDGSPPSEAMLERGLPDVTYADAITLHVNGQTVRAVHYPASHTDGDTVVFFEEAGAVHLGDLFFAGRFPFVDLDGGGSVDGLIAAIEEIHGQLADDARLIPGHGPLSTKADLAAYLAMLKDCRARVAEALEAGQSAEDMKAGELLADYADWSWGFIPAERFIDTLVADAGR